MRPVDPEMLHKSLCDVPLSEIEHKKCKKLACVSVPLWRLERALCSHYALSLDREGQTQTKRDRGRQRSPFGVTVRCVVVGVRQELLPK